MWLHIYCTQSLVFSSQAANCFRSVKSLTGIICKRSCLSCICTWIFAISYHHTCELCSSRGDSEAPVVQRSSGSTSGILQMSQLFTISQRLSPGGGNYFEPLVSDISFQRAPAAVGNVLFSLSATDSSVNCDADSNTRTHAGIASCESLPCKTVAGSATNNKKLQCREVNTNSSTWLFLRSKGQKACKYHRNHLINIY